MWFDGSTFIANGGVADTAGTWRIVVCRANAGVPTMRENGQAVTTTGTVVSTSFAFELNAFGGSEFTNCEVFAVAAWSGVALSNADIERVEGALAWEAGLVAETLPASHPYRNAPPLIGV